MKKNPNLWIFVGIIGVLLIALVFSTCQVFRYQRKSNEIIKLISERQNKLEIIPNEPFFIFTNKIVSWENLVPHLKLIYPNDNIEKNIFGTFATPGDYKGTDITAIKCDNQKIYFSSFGEYYLHTSLGPFKILLLDPTQSKDSQILSVASFVAKNCVHSMANAQAIQPFPHIKTLAPGGLLKKLFTTDQPLKLYCFHVVEFLRFVLERLEYKTQKVYIFFKNKGSHRIMHVFLPKQNSYGMIDPDYGVIVRSKEGNVLSIQQILEAIKINPDSIIIENIGNKSWLKGLYNPGIAMRDFAWSVDKMEKGKTYTKESYIKMLSEIDHYDIGR
ncbi:hypothetical protein IM40_04885 [Candidatus Paracaedimonas acanthamoebae]|nr:hypothetical protein IM40_04885 [Candidatus Paracaedimonas acanthamoebae]